ncbi:MAG: FAD-dependent thymidylate synthase [Patescibacteria group bacterium]
MSFTPEEKALLEKYVTSAEENVFAIHGLSGIVGAVYARYSRAKGGFRETLLKEFLKDGIIDPKHADALIERVLIAYGDDSVGELEGTHVSFEEISMLATKEIEDRRIGGSPIEQSTRYVFYDQKNDKGEWRYLRHSSLIETSSGSEYVKTMDAIFAIYVGLIEPMKEYFGKMKPLEEAEYDVNGDGKKERWAELTSEAEQKAFRMTYNADLRTKACDVLRSLLPLATLTNVGMFGNGRFFQGVITHLLSTDIPEAITIGESAFKATSQVIPQYVRRAKRNEYQVETRRAMFALAESLFGNDLPSTHTNPSVMLMPEDSRDVSTFAAMLYPYSNRSLEAVRKFVANASEEVRMNIAKTYIGKRRTRRDRPGRALEDGYPYTFDLVTNWGVYKDLMRHRMNTQQRQLFTTKLGFEMPAEIIDAGYESQAKKCVELADKLFDLITTTDKTLAQYAVLHGHFARWSLGCNDREAEHLIELRTTPQGHTNYRKVGQMMHAEIAKRSPWRAKLFLGFTDHNDYFWARGDAEANQRVKERKLEEKQSSKTNQP